MKHPALTTLHDYFENELNHVQSELVKGHLFDCNYCSLILSQMAKVDTRFKTSHSIHVSSEMKNKIFSDAKILLAKKREKFERSQNNSKIINAKFEKLKLLLCRHLLEFKMPAFQLASLAVVIGLMVSANQDTQTIETKPLPEGVVVYTYGDHDSPVKGEEK